jgi:hypothetical protein
MAIDPNIALGVRSIELQNPLNALAQFSQIQNAQNQNAMAQLQMREAEAAAQEKNMLRRLDPTAADYESQLFKVSPQLGIAFRKEQAATEASRAATSSSLATAAKAKQQLLGQALRDISGRPSDANITAHTEDIQASPLFSKEEKAKALITQQTLLSIPFEQRQAYLAAQGASASELKPSTQTVNRSGGTDIVQVPAFSGAPTTVGSYADLPLPANVQAQKIQIAQQSRPPAQPVAPTVTQIVDPTNPKQMIAVDARRYQGGGVGSPGVIGVGGKEPGAGSLKPLTEGQTIKLRADVAKDYKAASTALSQIDDLLTSADAVKTSPGLSAATGFTGKFLPSFPEGAAAQAETRLANLRGKVTALGKATAAMSGAIGSIANQEWKILADQIAVLDEVKGKGPLLEQIALLEEQAKGAAARIRDTYEKSRAEDFERFPQFRDLPAPKAPGGNAPAAGTGGFKYLGKEGG